MTFNELTKAAGVSGEDNDKLIVGISKVSAKTETDRNIKSIIIFLICLVLLPCLKQIFVIQTLYHFVLHKNTTQHDGFSHALLQ